MWSCVTHPHGSGVCATTAAHHCAEGTSECNASTNPPSRDASMLAENSGRSGSVYLPGRTDRGTGGGKETRRSSKRDQSELWSVGSFGFVFRGQTVLCLP